jgi:peptide/nickel transport system substrate-binding protein
MLRWARLSILVCSLLLLTGTAVPLLAQGGEGGIIIDPNTNSGTDVATMNPLLNNDVYSAIITDFLYPTLIGIDPEQGVFAPGARDGLATSWEVSEDGLVYTYTLRDDWSWSDGTPITSNDFVYSYNAIASGDTSSPRSYAVAAIASVEAPDDHTLVITYNSPACNNLDNTNAIVPVPSHAIQEQIGEDFTLMDAMDFNMNPLVTAGPFSFAAFEPGQQVSLQANQAYPDSLEGFVSPTGFIYKNVNDVDVALEQFLAGELNLLDRFSAIPPQNYADLRTRGQNGEIQTFEQLDNGYQWLAFNLSDPTNPVNGLDEEGNVIEQPPHPIFGDARVRKALAMAVDMDAVIQGALFGEAVRATSPSIATSWAYNPDLAPIPFDVEAAQALLAEAGWTDEDGDGVLEAHGAMYVEDGTPLAFTMITGAGDTTVEAVGQILQDQLNSVGADVDFQAIDFNTAVQQLVGQTFDAALLGWSLSYPDDPDFGFAFNPENDVVGGGFNFVSYNNPEVTDLLNQANNLPGCDLAGRAALYQQAQQKLVDEQPYVFLYTLKRFLAASSNLDGFAPYANQAFWNVDSWALR